MENIRPHEAAVRGYLQSTFPAGDPDDVVQESYLKLLKAKTLGHVASAKAYFFSVARNTAITSFRRNQIYAPTPLCELPDSYILEDRADASETANAQHRHELVIQAIELLPARCRDILQLAILHGMSNAEIARKLGVAEVTTRVQLARGMKRIVAFLREQGERT